MKDVLSSAKVDKVKSSYNLLENIINQVVSESTKGLNGIVKKTREKIKKKTITNRELEDLILDLPLEVYYINTVLEQVSLKESIAKEFTKEKYSDTLLEMKGTVSAKEAQAELDSMEERMITLMYKNSYTRIKDRRDIALELLASCKKILTTRVAEMEK